MKRGVWFAALILALTVWTPGQVSAASSNAGEVGKPHLGCLLEVPVPDVGREYQTGVRTAAGYQQPLHSHSDVFIRCAVPDRAGNWLLGAHSHDGCDPRARGDGQHGGI